MICMEIEHTVRNEGGVDPLAAHDLIMATGLYQPFEFAGSKFEASPLKAIASRDRLSSFRDNVIYLTTSMREELPAHLFVA